jgi:hypothetical protein
MIGEAQIDGLRAYRERVAVEMAARREDVLWMAETGESLSGAAKRLGIKVDALERWCDKNDMRDELRKLRSREPADLLVSEHARMGASARRSA